MLRVVLSTLSFFIFLTVGAQSVATIQWQAINANKSLIQEKSICSFTDNDFFYQLKLERAGYRMEEWLPMLEILDQEKQKSNAVLINLGAGNYGERLSIASARFKNGLIQFVGVGNLSAGKYFFYTGQITLKGELKGKLKEIDIPLNAARSKGIPYVVSGNEEKTGNVFTALMFFPTDKFTDNTNLNFKDIANPEVGIAILSENYEFVQSGKLSFDIKAAEFNIQNCVLSNEGDILFIANTGKEKKSNTILFHTHVFKLNGFEKVTLDHQPRFGKQVLIEDNATVFVVAYSNQEEAKDKAEIKVKIFEKGGFVFKKELTLLAENKELSMPKSARNFDLKLLSLKPAGVVLLGAFYELKPSKKENGKLPKPDTKLENYYLLIQQELSGNSMLHHIPVFTEYGPFSPSYQIDDGTLRMVMNNHQSNIVAENAKYSFLRTKDIGKKAQLVCLQIMLNSGKTERQVLVQTKEKYRLLTATAHFYKGVFTIEAIEKGNSSYTEKNIIKTAIINFN